MKIATWNIERLKHRPYCAEMLSICDRIGADILVLTETDMRFQLSMPFSFHTPLLSETEPDCYKPTENRVSIFTKYKCTAQYATFDSRTALCLELDTDAGPLIVYGTIIGIYGNRHPSFKDDLDKQLIDFKRLSLLRKPLCICGDFNCSFIDNYYFTNDARRKLSTFFSDYGMRLATASVPECIDHIAVSESLIGSAVPQIEEWNLDKRLSDHKGIAVSMNRINKSEIFGTEQPPEQRIRKLLAFTTNFLM